MATTVTATGIISQAGSTSDGREFNMHITYDWIATNQCNINISFSGGHLEHGSTYAANPQNYHIRCVGTLTINGIKQDQYQKDGWTTNHNMFIWPQLYVTGEYWWADCGANTIITSTSSIPVNFHYEYSGCYCDISYTIPYEGGTPINPGEDEPGGKDEPIPSGGGDEPSSDEQHQENPNAVIKSYEHITATGLNALKTKIKTMYANRPLLTTQQRDYAGTALNTNYFQPYDNTEINQIGDLINACLVVNDIPNLKYNDLNNNNGYVNLYENIFSDGTNTNLLTWLSDTKRDATGNSSDHGCRGACVGICSGGCFNTCINSCDTNCSDGCRGSQSGNTGGNNYYCSCGSACTAICNNSSDSNCNECGAGCESSCWAKCENACGQSCYGGCNWDCGTGCYNSCSSGCDNICKNHCNTTCEGYCDNSCDNSCAVNCTSHCYGSVTNGCYGCTSNCGISCQTNCQYSNEGSPACNDCTGSCSGGCTTVCSEGCGSNCSGSCSTTCSEGCASTCASCTNMCGTSCNKTCSVICTGTCGNGCGGTCGQHCGNNCAGNCTETCTSSATTN